MSDTHSISSVGDLSSSVPIFSADDQNIELVDPDYIPISPSNKLGSLPYGDNAKSQSRTYLNSGDRSHPVSLDFLNSSPSLLYSFTDSTEHSAPAVSTSSRKKARSGIVDSFGVSPDQYQPALAKPRQLQSPPSLPTSDTNRAGEGIVSASGHNSEEVDAVSYTTPPQSNGFGASASEVPKLSTPLPSVAGGSRDHTPTPESANDTHVASKHLPGSPLREDPKLVGLSHPPARDDEHSRTSTPTCNTVASGSIGSDQEQIPLMSSFDSDLETASVVSIQQLTETYLNEPADSLADQVTPLNQEGKVPFKFLGSSAVGQVLSTPSPVGVQGRFLPQLSPKEPSRAQNKFNQHTHTELPSPGRIPAHINPSLSKRSLPPPSSPLKTPSQNLSNGNKPLSFSRPGVSGESHSATYPSQSSDGDGVVNTLEGRLAEEKRARMYLEGQLEAVKEECEAALRERPKLLSKLSRAETELEEMVSALEKERSKQNLKSKSSSEDGPEQAVRALKESKEALEQEKKVSADLKDHLHKEEQKSHQLERDLEDAKQDLGSQKSDISALRDKLQKSQTEVARKAGEVEEMTSKLSSLEAGYGSLEKNKSWLHDQLQDAQKTKLKLQEELRESKAMGIAHSIKSDQLQQENSALQEQIADLLKGVLQDKAKMADQLEAITADVLSHEDLYTRLIAEKTQLADTIKRKDEAVTQLSSEVAKGQVGQHELKQEADKVLAERDELLHRTDNLHRENKTLSSKLSSALRDLADRESDLKETERMKTSLQDRLRQGDAEAVGKDGTIQSLKDANQLLQQELDLVSESKESVERESAEAKQEAALLEAKLKSALDKCKEKDLQLRGVAESRHSMDDQKQTLRALLAEKDEEIEQKEEAIRSLEAQMREVLGEFGTLKDNFKSIASESGSVTDNMAEKDRVISHLALEKDKSEEKLRLFEQENQNLHGKVEGLQHERAHLLGQVEGSINPEDYKKALHDKAQLQDELNTLRVDRKCEDVKAQSKLNKLESELKVARKAASDAEKELQNSTDAREDEVRKSEEARRRTEADLREVQEKLQRALKDKGQTEGVLSSLKSSERQIHEMLKVKCEQLTSQNDELTEQLQQVTQKKADVERASGLVATKLKQNAEREKKELMEKNSDLLLEMERLRGRLTGMHTTQVTIRDHATNLELALAKKESSIVRLSTEAQKILEENKTFGAQVADLQEQLKSLRTDLGSQQDRDRISKQKVEELERELKQHSANKQEELSKKDSDIVSATNEQLAALALEKDRLQSDLDYLKSQLLIAKTSAESAKRQVADRNSQVDILERELKITVSRSEQAEEEARQFREQLKTANARHRNEVEELRRAVEEAGRRKGGARNQTGLLDTDLSAIGGAVDEADWPGHNMSGEILGMEFESTMLLLCSHCFIGASAEFESITGDKEKVRIELSILGPI